MRLPRNARIFRGRLDAGPFVGVFFILLMFILLHTSLVSHPGVGINLPASDRMPGPEGPTVVVAIDSAGAVYFENQAIHQSELELRLRDRVAGLKQPVTLVVQADKSVAYSTLVGLSGMARRAGIQDLVLATRGRSLAAPVAAAPQAGGRESPANGQADPP